MKDDIAYSFIVPVYNAEKCLARCLDSIINQTGHQFEIIVVNDGSVDSSQQIIDEYVATYPDKIKAYQKVNGGPGDTRNYGVQKAGGRYVAFVDSDDYIEPNYLKVVERCIHQHHPDIVILSYNRIYNWKKNVFEKNYQFNQWSLFNEVININSHPELIGKMEGAPWLKFVKRDLFLQNPSCYFADGRMAEDLEASLKWYVHAARIVVLREKLYNYCIQPNSLNFVPTHITDFVGLIDVVCNYYQQYHKFELCATQLEYLLTKHLLLSNMLRLRSSSMKNKYQLFMTLRTALMHYFPSYQTNVNLRDEPFYSRMAIQLSYYCPLLFRVIL